MAAPTRVGHVTVNQNTGTTTATLTPDGTIVDGDWMLLTYMAAAAATPATPTGWTLLSALASFGTRTAAVWGRVRQSGDTSYTITYPSATNGMQANLMWGAGADSTVSNWIVGAGETRAAAGGTFSNVAPSITTLADHSLAVVVSFEATSANESDVSSITGATEWFFAPQTTSPMIHTLSVSYLDQTPAGATGAVTITYPNTQSSNGWALQIGMPADASAVTGTASLSGSGSLSATGAPSWADSAAFTAAGVLSGVASSTVTGTAALSGTGVLSSTGTPSPSGTATFTGSGSLTGAGTPATVGTAALSATGVLTAGTSTPVQLWIAATPMYVAHRNAELDWPEETLFGYQQAAQWSTTQALEISVQQSSDGVWVASHDQTTGRVFSGTSLDIPSNTWTTLSTKTTIIGSKPIAKMVDILDAHTDRILWADNKNTVNISAFLDTLDAHGGPSRIIVKGYAGSTAYSDAARARGYKTWGFFYDADTPSIGSWAPHWDLLGEDYTASGTSWTAILGQGKPVLAHTIATAANKATATSLGAVGFMASSDVQVVPQTPAQVTLSGSGGLTAAGTVVSGAAFSATGVLSASGAQTQTGSAVLSGSGVLETAGKPATVGSAGFSAAGVLSAAGAPSIAGVLSLSGSGSLSGGSHTFSGTANLTGNGVITTAGVPSSVGTAALSSVGSLAASGVPSFVGAASYSGVGVLTITATPKFTGALNLTGSGSLTTAGSAHSSRVALLAGAGVLTVTASPALTGALNLSGVGTLVGSQLNPPTNITVTTKLGDRRWDASLAVRNKTAQLEPRRWEAHLD